MIAFGMWLFGPESSTGWRFSSAVVGTAAVAIVIVIATRLFRSQTLGCVAGLLLAMDGQELVLSRTGLLDIFLMFWVLVAAWLILKDRDQMDRRLDVRLHVPIGHGPTGAPLYADRRFGPGLGMRWYLAGAGVALGLACGVKWSGLYFLAVFGILVVCWDAASRRAAGIREWIVGAVSRDGFKAFVLLVPVAIVTYVASWAGWFASTKGYMRDWAANNPGEGLTWLPAPLRSLVEYHRQAFGFHTSLNSPHDYQSNPWGWLVQERTTSMFYETQSTCGQAECSQAITAFGNPMLWWIGLIGLGVVIYGALVWADRRAWFVLAGYLGGYVPWLFFSQRTIFTFYTVILAPFVALAVTYAIGLAIGPRLASPTRRTVGVVVSGIVVILVVLAAAFFWQVWTGESIPLRHWQWRMWLNSWI
jgi:dolichyl-phosphate-mannose--protein O-mannosyl transferase